MQPRSKLAAIFSPTRRLIGPEPELVRAGGVLGGLEWVVPRADCLYRRIDLESLPPRQRAAAVRIAARRHEPRPEAQFHVAWTGPVAHVWTWPAAVAGVASGEATWVPESLLRERPAGDGVRLLQQVRGVEGQSWRDGRLQASQWWPSRPAAGDWLRFVRACGFGPESGERVPEPEALRWSDPWGDPQRGLPASPLILERWAWFAGLGLIAFALGWQVVAHAQWTMAQSRLDAKMDALRARAAPLLAARERADGARDALVALRQLGSGPSDYRLMADVIAPLPADARITAWQREDTHLQVTIASSDMDPRHFVSAYDGKPLLSGVIATPADGAMGLAFDLGPAAAGAGKEPAP